MVVNNLVEASIDLFRYPGNYMCTTVAHAVVAPPWRTGRPIGTYNRAYPLQRCAPAIDRVSSV